MMYLINGYGWSVFRYYFKHSLIYLNNVANYNNAMYRRIITVWDKMPE